MPNFLEDVGWIAGFWRERHDCEGKDQRDQAKANPERLFPDEQETPDQHAEDGDLPDFLQPRPFYMVKVVMAQGDLGRVRMHSVDRAEESNDEHHEEKSIKHAHVGPMISRIIGALKDF